jgi:NADH-quinone oxidoreductase subunit L
MIFMTFWGEWRGPRAVWDHVHESVPTMVAPLVILSVPTALAGLLLGIPPEGGVIHSWLEEVFHAAEESHAGVQPGSIADTGHEGFQLIGSGGLLLGTGTLVAELGVWLAYRWYVRDPEAPRRFVERIPLGLGPGMYLASVNKYYVDDFYQLVFARGGVLIANALWWFDAKIIDGAVNGTGWLARTIGSGLRKIQTGRVENYGLGIAAGLAVVILVLSTVVR